MVVPPTLQLLTLGAPQPGTNQAADQEQIVIRLG
jgi:hypothetical protein